MRSLVYICRSEGELVTKVVGKVLELANKPLPLALGDYVVGVNEVAERVIQTLDEKKTVLMLGLWGTGGIGKSTLARELYNRMSRRFDAACYVEDVTEKVIQGGVVKVQNRSLGDLFPKESWNTEDKSRGKVIMEERLFKK
jgi:replication-associated recombination protein RarA